MIREKKLSEKETLVIFYAVIEIVCKLHEANIVHRLVLNMSILVLLDLLAPDLLALTWWLRLDYADY